MKKKEIIMSLRKIAKKDNLPTSGIEILEITKQGVRVMFPTNEAFPPVWFRFLTFDELKNNL